MQNYRMDFPFCLDDLPIANGVCLEDFAIRCSDALTLGIGLTGRCNFHCPMCYWHNCEYSPATDIPFDLLKKVLHAVYGIGKIAFALEGEPFLYPDFPAVLEIAADNAKSVSITSNGSMINRETANVLKHIPISELILSIDSPDPEVYAAMRRGGDLAAFCGSATLAADTLGTSVCFHAVLCNWNEKSLPQLPELASKIGIGKISVASLRMHPGLSRNGIEPSAARCAVLERLKESASTYGVKLYIDPVLCQVPNDLPNEEYTSRHSTCQIPFQFTSILSNGTLFPCCGDFTPSPLQGMDFESIFNHEYLLRLRSLMYGAGPYPCRVCTGLNIL